MPCAIDNDAVAAAIGENACGAGGNSPALLAITLGTGVGVAVLTGGNAPYRGSDGTHPKPDTSRSPVHPRRATADWAHAGNSSPPAPPWTPPPATPPPSSLPGQQLATSTAAASSTATQNTSASASATLTAVFRPARVVICGSAAQYLPLSRPGLDRALTRAQPYTWAPPITAAQLGEFSGAIGAAILARTPG